MTPVKTAVLRFLDDDSTLISRWQLLDYTWLLARADVRQEKPGKDAELGAQFRASDRWLAVYENKLLERSAKLPAPQYAEYILDRLSVKPTLSPAEVANWKLVLDNRSAMRREKQYDLVGKVERCRCKELVPNLEALAADVRLEPSLRGAAIVALHAMDKDPQREVVYADCISEKPKFSKDVHLTLGEYKAAEVGRALLKLLESPQEEVRDSAAGRLVDFGWALKADELKAALARWLASDHTPHEREFVGTPQLLGALAIASPDMALQFIKDIILAAPADEHGYNFLRRTAFSLLVCIESPVALKLINDSLSSPNEEVRGEVANALGYSWHSGRPEEPPKEEVADPRKRHMKGTNRIPGKFYPKLLQLYKFDPSNKVRVEARRALILITGVGNGTWSATQVQEKQWLSEWETWWQKNRSRFEEY